MKSVSDDVHWLALGQSLGWRQLMLVKSINYHLLPFVCMCKCVFVCLFVCAFCVFVCANILIITQRFPHLHTGCWWLFNLLCEVALKLECEGVLSPWEDRKRSCAKREPLSTLLAQFSLLISQSTQAFHSKEISFSSCRLLFFVSCQSAFLFGRPLQAASRGC